MSPVRKLDKTKLWYEVKNDGKIKYSPWPENTPRDNKFKYF
jgi:hypothetical protein